MKEGVAKGARAMALTNINNTCDTWDFVDFCKEQGIKPIAGAEIRNGDTFMYVLLAKNNNSFFGINRFLSTHLSGKQPFPDKPTLEDVFVIYAFDKIPAQELGENELLGVQTTEVNKIFRQPVLAYPGKYVILQPVVFQQDKRYYYLHRLLRAVDRNILLSMQLKEQVAERHATFVGQSALLEQFSLYPSIVTNTLRVIDQCSIDLVFHTDKTKQIYSGARKDDKQLLAKLAREGMQKRYGHFNSRRNG